jgi:hypothetical protein
MTDPGSVKHGRLPRVAQSSSCVSPRPGGQRNPPQIRQSVGRDNADMPLIASIPDWAPVASATLAAVAAAASWKSALTTNRAAREARWPLLVTQPMFDPGTSDLQLRVENVGGGVARQVFFYLGFGSVRTVGLVPTGFLRPGEGVSFVIDAKHDPNVDAKVVTICNDAWGVLHAWRIDGEHRTYQSRGWRPIGSRRDWPIDEPEGDTTGITWYFQQMYPEIDLGQFEVVDWRLLSTPGGGHHHRRT